MHSFIFLLIGLIVMVGAFLVVIHLKNNAQFYDMRKLAILFVVGLIVVAVVVFIMMFILRAPLPAALG